MLYNLCAIVSASEQRRKPSHMGTKKSRPGSQPLGGFSHAPNTQILKRGEIIMSGVTCQIKNYKALRKQIEDMKKAPRAVMKAMTSDAKKRVPPWVAAEVSKVYGVKKSEISGGDLGKVQVKGDSLDEVKITYTGRVLTPTHFGMNPTAPKIGGSYTLKATIIRGQRTSLGKVKKLTKKQRAELSKNFTRSGTRNSKRSPIMLMRTGNTKEGGTNYIPFQRVSPNRKDVVAIKTISLPQMVSSERTEQAIQNAISEGLGKRLDHHMKRYMGK